MGYNDWGLLDRLYWSPEELADLATELSRIATEEIEVYIKEAYTHVDELGTSKAWTGKLFNDLADLMNDQKGLFETNIKILAEEIPGKLSESANADARASDAPLPTYTPSSVSSDYEVTLTDDDGTGTLTFEAETVGEKNTAFTTALKNALDGLNHYKEEFSKILDEALSTKARAYSAYIGVAERVHAQCSEKFTEFSTTYIEKAQASEEAINAADTESGEKAEEIDV